MRIVMTYELAMGAGRDAANRQMRRESRKSWNVRDYNLACDVFDKLWSKGDLTKERGFYESKN